MIYKLCLTDISVGGAGRGSSGDTGPLEGIRDGRTLPRPRPRTAARGVHSSQRAKMRAVSSAGSVVRTQTMELQRQVRSARTETPVHGSLYSRPASLHPSLCYLGAIYRPHPFCYYAAAWISLRGGRRGGACTHHRPRRPVDVDVSGSVDVEWWCTHTLVARVLASRIPIDLAGIPGATLIILGAAACPPHTRVIHRRTRDGGARTLLAQVSYSCLRARPIYHRIRTRRFLKLTHPVPALPCLAGLSQHVDAGLRRPRWFPYKTPSPSSRPFPGS